MAETASAIDADGAPSSSFTRKNDEIPTTDDTQITKQPLYTFNERYDAKLSLPSAERVKTTHGTKFSHDNVKASVGDDGKENQELGGGETKEKGKRQPDDEDDSDNEKKEPIRRPKETWVDFNNRMWKLEIDRTTILSWRKRDPFHGKYPRPVLQVFYIRKPDPSNTSKKEVDNVKIAAKEDHGDTLDVSGEMKNIQRIGFNHRRVYHDKSDDYLMHAYSMIPARLLDIEEEIRKANERIAATEKQFSVSRILMDKTTDDALIETDADKLPSISTTNQISLASTSDLTSRTKPDSRINTAIDQRDEIKSRYTQLQTLYDFITEELSNVLELRKRIVNGTITRIRFDDLWHMFNPGEKIFSDEKGHKQLYTVYAVTGGLPLLRHLNRQEIAEMDFLRASGRRWRTNDSDDDEEEPIEQKFRGQSMSIGSLMPFKIDCYYVSFDGEYCGPIEESKEIAPYSGEREITDLSVFPLRFHPEHNDVLAKLQARGKKALFSTGHKSYEGYTVAMRSSSSRVEIQSDVYVDFKAYYDDHPVREPRFGNLRRSKQDQFLVEEKYHQSMDLSGHEIDTMRSDQYLTTNRRFLEQTKAAKDKVSLEYLGLVHYYVFAYIFQLRTWGRLDVNLVKDIDQESAEAKATGFQDLVIPTRYRDLLVALVDSHISGNQRGKGKPKRPPTQIDLVRGKGQGLIVLLHGPPGAGKTSTAETIAAYTRRPLYSITCGDLGTSPEDVEKKLLAHTKRADKWGCVLLLDEADVFLGRRDWNNMERNALVSIFLRQLEYYAGILFLTTNRIGGIDEAFKSRVHISLRYPSIDLSSTNQMWSNIMNRIEKDNKDLDVKVTFNRESLLEFAQRHFEKCQAAGVTWNGRQIRNAFQTALALGHHERLTKIKEAGLTADEAMATGKKKWRVVKLTKANFQSIAKTSREFEEYIASVRGDDTTNAVNDELRRDDYDPERPKARKSYPAPRAQAGSSKGKKAARKEQPPSEEDDESEDEEDESDEREDSD